MLTLSISHSIFLTLSQRYSLIDSQPVEIVAHNIPVWYFHGSTSEPAVEVFCKYKLLNDREKDYYVNFSGNSYEINLPNLPKEFKKARRLTNDEWRKLSKKQLDDWYSAAKTPPSVLDLQSEAVGGSGYLHFKCFDKMKKNGRLISIVHNVEIDTMHNLVESLEF